MIRVVFDTNTIISAQFWLGAPRQALDAIRIGAAKLVVSEQLMTELRTVLARAKFAQRIAVIGSTVENMIADHRALVEIVEATPLPTPVCDDPKDDMVLACAVGGKADYIVSGDDDLLRLQSYQDIFIINVNTFLELLSNANQ